MSFNLIDYPTHIPLDDYERLKNKLTQKLIEHPSVLSVYQMGSVRAPGISDLDLICVFKNNSKNDNNLRQALSKDEKKILTHGIFGVEEQDLKKAISFNLLSNLELIGGKNLFIDNYKTHNDESLKHQIALEYIVKMFITLNKQLTFRTVKLRSFLLLGKAILFDLELLGIKNGKLYDDVMRIIEFRQNWSNKSPDRIDFQELICSFHANLYDLLNDQLSKHKFYLPKLSIALSGNAKIVAGKEIQVKHSGVVLPKQLSFIGRKIVNLQYRFNSFEYSIPIEVPNHSSIISERFEFGKHLFVKNENNYPNFTALTSSLPIYR